MPLRVTCQCGTVYRIEKRPASGRFSCKKCGKTVNLPAPADSAQAAAPPAAAKPAVGPRRAPPKRPGASVAGKGRAPRPAARARPRPRTASVTHHATDALQALQHKKKNPWLVFGVPAVLALATVLILFGTRKSNEELGALPPPSTQPQLSPEELAKQEAERKAKLQEAALEQGVFEAAGVDPYAVFDEFLAKVRSAAKEGDKQKIYDALYWLEDNKYDKVVDRIMAYKYVLRVDLADPWANVAYGNEPYMGPIERFHGRKLRNDEFLDARDEERELLRQDKLENPGAGPFAELHGRGDDSGGASPDDSGGTNGEAGGSGAEGE